MQQASSRFFPLPTPDLDADQLANRIRLIMELRNRGIHDTAVLSAMEQTPREYFVEQPFFEHAYDDTALPIASGQTISQPSVVAQMTLALELLPSLRVLEIGTGSGYQAAILARLSRRVYTIERHKELLLTATQRFKALRLGNIVTRLGDGSKGWREAAPYDRIIVTAAAGQIPAALVEQLVPGGVMVVPVGSSAENQMLVRLRKDAAGMISAEHLMSVRFVPLVDGK